MARKSSGRGKKSRNDDALIAKLRLFIRTHGSNYLEDPNITSIGIGKKISNGRRTNEVCLQFTVADKPDQVGAVPEGVDTELIPSNIVVEGESIPTDVIQRNFELSYELIEPEEVARVSDRKRSRDPLVPGIGVSHPNGTAVTLGMIVFDLATDSRCMLGNWHVHHRAFGELGDDAVQPGSLDNRRVDKNRAGQLLRSHLPDRAFEREILELGVIPARIARVEIDDKVIESVVWRDLCRSQAGGFLEQTS